MVQYEGQFERVENIRLWAISVEFQHDLTWTREDVYVRQTRVNNEPGRVAQQSVGTH